MEPQQLEALKASRPVVVSVVAAAAAVVLLCLVGIAKLLGWTPVASPAAVAAARTAAAKPADSAVALAPGEVLVEPPSVYPKTPPMMPTYSPPAAPKPAPPPEPEAAPASPPKPRVAERPPVRIERSDVAVAPIRPRYAHPTDPGDDWPRSAVCRSCGTVTSITTFPDLWEVRVRFDDGASRIVRYSRRPGHRIGDRVRLEDGHLERE